MKDFDNEMLIVTVSIVSIVYLFYASMFKHKKLTNFQQQNRWKLIYRQCSIIISLLIFAFTFDFANKNYLYEIYVNLNFKPISLDIFISAAFIVVTFILLMLNHKMNQYISAKDERIVNIKQQATFRNFQVRKQKVKKIKFYSHYFNAIAIERSAKDYSIQNVKLNIDFHDVAKFREEQEKAEIKISHFYKRLINYINSKYEIFNFEKIENSEIEECVNMLELKILIFKRFENLTNKQYFASISQLFQIANNDETEFLTFLRDSQHRKFSSRSIKHASVFIMKGVIK